MSWLPTWWRTGYWRTGRFDVGEIEQRDLAPPLRRARIGRFLQPGQECLAAAGPGQLDERRRQAAPRRFSGCTLATIWPYWYITEPAHSIAK